MSLKVSQPSRRILVADDDAAVRHLLTAIIEREGYSAVVVKDGREAFRLLQADADFVCAILDMIMPNLNGLEVIRYMRTEKRLMRIPVLMITSENDLQLTAAGFKAGASVLLPRPFTPVQFQATFKMLVNVNSVAA
jgi:CheY-like chemotaxis protein